MKKVESSKEDCMTFVLTQEENLPYTGVQKVTLAEGNSVLIGNQLNEEQVQKATEMLKRHRDAFAWSYKDVKGVLPTFCQHYIHMKEGSTLVKQPQWRLNLAKM